MKITLLFAKGILLFCSLLLLKATPSLGQGNWTRLYATGRHVKDVQMLNFNTIVAVGGRESNDAITSVFRRSNCGQIWDIILDVPYSPWLRAVHFPAEGAFRQRKPASVQRKRVAAEWNPFDVVRCMLSRANGITHLDLRHKTRRLQLVCRDVGEVVVLVE